MKHRVNSELNDTIASVATFPAQAAVGIIKISGPKALNIASKVFISKKKKNLKKVKTYTLHYGWIVDSIKPKAKNLKQKGQVIDEVLVAVMKGPFSYTREDVVEIHSHSGQVVLSKILELVLEKGARLALPGEFTKRAFLSGRIDLVQAEAVLDLVRAGSEQALNLSLTQLRGRLSAELNHIEETLRKVCAELEAELSFPEQVKINKNSIVKKVKLLADKLHNLLKYSKEGAFLREGVRCVICGRPNVGKSSLLNMLLREERVIVTPRAGTTRDVIEDSINIRGLPLKIYDTAGILEPKDLISKKAVEKSYKKIEEADLILLVLDGATSLTPGDTKLIDKVRQKKIIFVINKIDLPQKIKTDGLSKYRSGVVKVSATESKGLGALERAIVKVMLKEGLNKSKDIFVSNLRHIELIKEALGLVCAGREYFNQSASLDFAFFSLKGALELLGQITGRVSSRDILDSIFSDFCIGK